MKNNFVEMNSILEPSILFISNEEWGDPRKRDAFLERLLNHLDRISTYSITKIYWTDALDKLLISHIDSPRWISDTNWRNRLCPIIYKKFNPIKLIIDLKLYQSVCQSDPILPCCNINTKMILERFLELVHIIIDKNENVYFCLNFNGQKLNRLYYSFSCQCHNNHLEPTIIFDPDDWFNYINILSVCWPQNIQDKSKFRLAIEVTLKKHLFKQETDICYEYEFSENFIRDISKELTHRKDILHGLLQKD